jgi:adenylosuccinate synthase
VGDSFFFMCVAFAESVADLDRLAKVEVIYTTLPGWKTDISTCKKFEDLPENCVSYIKFIEDFLGVKIQYIGVGPEREETIRVF